MARSSWVRALAVVALAASLAQAGCGRRGALEPPPDASAAAAAPDDPVAVQPIPRRPKKVPIQHPADSFILDPLL